MAIDTKGQIYGKSYICRVHVVVPCEQSHKFQSMHVIQVYLAMKVFKIKLCHRFKYF